MSGQFTTPIKVNAVDPQRLIIGAANGVFESLDQGDTVRRIATLGVNDQGRDPIAYGAGSNPDALYLGSGGSVYVRTAPHPAPLTRSLTFPGSTGVVDLALDPADPSAAYVATQDAVYRTLDAGASWTNVTGNLLVQAQVPLRSLAYLAGAVDDAVAIGANDGVFVAFQSDGFAVWDRLGSGLPTVPVFDLDFDVDDNLLVAGTLGRGSWKLTSVLEQDGEPPVAEFTVVCSLLTCQLDGSLSTDNVGIESYVWDFGDGSPLGSGVTTSHVYATPGKYTVTLTVTDFAGNSDSDSDTAVADRDPPTALFTIVCNLLSCGFDASASFDDIEILSYVWDFGDGSPLVEGITPTHVYAVPGKYNVTLTVTDCAGKTDVETGLAIADAAPPQPVITLVGCTGLTCEFDASGSTDDTEIVSYEWDFGDGSQPVQGINPTHAYAAPGVYTVTLTVVDCAGKSASTTAPVDLDEPPVACFETTCSNLTCTFDASCSSDDVGIATFAWNFGDGGTETGQMATHAYFRDGAFTVTLTVTDTIGQSDSVTADVTVVDEEAFLILHVLCP